MTEPTDFEELNRAAVRDLDAWAEWASSLGASDAVVSEARMATQMTAAALSRTMKRPDGEAPLVIMMDLLAELQQFLDHGDDLIEQLLVNGVSPDVARSCAERYAEHCQLWAGVMAAERVAASRRSE